jgi:polyisoprenoid-binding protein YceI
METTAVLTKTKWNIDSSHSEVSFKVKHLMITHVSGKFNEFEGSVITTGNDFMTGVIDFWLNPASVDTGDEKRDGHVQSADFFDVENHKKITFTSNSCKKKNEAGHYELNGDLTIKGITKNIHLDVEFTGSMTDPWGNEKAGFTIRGIINRKDWGLNWNAALEAGGVLVSDEVKINCEVQLVKEA